ncbi:GNAT family N-acetyltransferase [Roseibium denhamense]|uniref:Ribosomal protein S18 acetylase RimI n=1 Tax=Roseibium denhamense TaxID=76305 RepID=A0ABY1PF55_9HYPH|nr:GNAT family N-acetyltransferase [Roseibium denhamense]MTI06190.1 GNAT family N-acetyltransferase [Roseibium denhamense]SMP32443.1 Ribosomal protein S18 acetylase RimI [Roseibium denhamense]
MTSPDAPVSIRAAEFDDLPDVLKLLRCLNPQDLHAPAEKHHETFERMLNLPGLTVFLAHLGSKAVATCTLMVIPNLTRGSSPFALIENVVTHPDVRGQGIGRQLITAVCDNAWKEGCFKIMLLSGTQNEKAHRFYEQMGFQTTKKGFELRRPGFPVRRPT